jgi:hypothetical protein
MEGIKTGVIINNQGEAVGISKTDVFIDLPVFLRDL